MSTAVDLEPSYDDFILAKKAEAPARGFAPPLPLHDVLFAWQRPPVAWALALGCAALFESFGLGKTLQGLEIARQAAAHTGGRALVVAPLGVRAEFLRDAARLGLDLRFVRRTEECAAPGVYLTNYEAVRDGRLDPRGFACVVLDEADCLRGMGGTKTFRTFMRLIAEAGVPYRFVLTATPSPNEYEELLAYAAFLGVMDPGQARTRFFRRDSEHADHLTLHPHKVREFWAWVASWALFITRPSDLGPEYSDAGYALPPLRVHWHELPTDHADAGAERDGQLRLVRDSAVGVTAAAREKRDSLERRVAKVRELVAALRGPDGRPSDQPIVWCDLNDEQRALERALAGEGLTVASLYGSQDVDEREALLAAWKAGDRDAFLSKPVMYGAGVNLQQSHSMVFAGIGFKFREFVQAVHRVHRFQQRHPCDVHVVYTDAEREVRRALERKWRQHDELVAQMTALVREHGLARGAAAAHLARATTVERREAAGPGWCLVQNDTVRETRAMAADSVDLVLSSIPFSTQYEYTPSYLDFGHTDSNAHFWAQMDFLTPEILRVLRPGRVCAIHVKDRIVPGGLTGLGFQTVYEFHADAIRHFKAHGFAYLGMKTIVTDVVRENAQTYRLGWTEQCKDGSRMGCGMPEYLLLFRKPPTDRSNGYADVPVVKSKEAYSRARWQFDAHGFMRSSGNRLLASEDLAGIPHEKVFKLFRRHSLTRVYDFEHDVRLAEALDARGMLPPSFMLLQPQSWHEDVWTDVARMRTLNALQVAQNRAMHVCPMQFDIADRVIQQFTMPGETVFDPFVGIGTVVRQAILAGRAGRGHELNPGYWADAVHYCRAAEREVSVPTLFDLDAGTAGEGDAPEASADAE